MHAAPLRPQVESPSLVSILVAAYRAERTIRRSLESFQQQSYGRTEIIVVDSSPDDASELQIGRDLPGVRFWRCPLRLMPGAAHNRCAELAKGDLLLFTNPDIYAPADWVERLLKTHKRFGGAIAGSLSCHGDGWLAQGMHLAKFDELLPGGQVRPTSLGAAANLLVERASFEAAGGFGDDPWVEDAQLCWKLRQRGESIWFEPRAAVEHHHLGGWQDLLGERFIRGRVFGEMRIRHQMWGRPRVFGQLLLTLLPLRLGHLVGRTGRNAWTASLLATFLVTLPVVVSGHAAWLSGEALAYLRYLVSARG